MNLRPDRATAADILNSRVFTHTVVSEETAAPSDSTEWHVYRGSSDESNETGGSTGFARDVMSEDELTTRLEELATVTSLSGSGMLAGTYELDANMLSGPITLPTVDPDSFSWYETPSLSIAQNGVMTTTDDGVEKTVNVFELEERIVKLESIVQAQKEMLDRYLDHDNFQRRIR